MQGTTDVKKTQTLDSGKQLEKPESPETSASLSRDLAMQLLTLMKRVTASDVTPSTVNAACNCASEIHKILRLNHEMKKYGL
jgi:hypothetical protein